MQVPEVIWLDGRDAVPEADVGPRAALLARLIGARVPVPQGFVLTRALYQRFASDAQKSVSGDAEHGVSLIRLSPEATEAIVRGARALHGPVAVRRSPLAAAPHTPGRPIHGRADRESYLHLIDPIDILEAVRRIWAIAATAAAGDRPPTAVMVQRFVLPDASALVKPDGADPARLVVESSYGIGDLLAADLVVPDRQVIMRADGKVVATRVGRKAQMTVPRNDGGVLRVPVPPESARALALDAELLHNLAKVHRDAERAVGPLAAMCASAVGSAWHITGARAIDQPPCDQLLG